MPRQLPLIPGKARLLHGGDTRKGKRKLMRPLDPRRPLHLVLRSRRARGAWSLLHPHHQGRVRAQVEELAHEQGVRILNFANVGNHLHILLKTPSRRAFQTYLRRLTGAIAMGVTGARKGKPVGRFWDELAFSRVVSWGRDYSQVFSYLMKNMLEGAGLLKRHGPEDEELFISPVEDLGRVSKRSGKAKRGPPPKRRTAPH